MQMFFFLCNSKKAVHRQMACLIEILFHRDTDLLRQKSLCLYVYGVIKDTESHSYINVRTIQH